MFNIFVEDPTDSTGQGKIHVWQNSWGLSTRTIGVMVMVHGDNQGLVLPPRVASIQVVVVPCGITAKFTDEQRQQMYDKCDELVSALRKVGIRARSDLREGYTPGWKFNEWEQKGVPLRLELGPQDLAKSQTIAVRRDTGVKAPLPLAELAQAVPALLETIQTEMFERARKTYHEHIIPVTKWDEVVPALDAKNVVVMPWCEVEECEDDIKERSGRA
jgi:prolyl-tRNA synthetase